MEPIESGHDAQDTLIRVVAVPATSPVMQCRKSMAMGSDSIDLFNAVAFRKGGEQDIGYITKINKNSIEYDPIDFRPLIFD